MTKEPHFNHYPRPRVFVSSVIEGFSEYREAARKAIESAGGLPILVNEDFPSLASTPRNACLDGVDSADIFCLIIGARGGWTAPSGKLVVEEELNHAQQRNLPIIVFIQDVEQDDEASILANSVSDYVAGNFRKTFDSPVSLRDIAEKALAPLVAQWRTPTMNADIVSNAISNPYTVHNEAVIRMALVPERSEEIIDPMTLGSKTFLDEIQGIAHAPETRLFNYHESKESKRERRSLVVLQGVRDANWKEGREIVRLEISENGQIFLDANVTGRHPRENAPGFEQMFVIAAEEIEEVLDRYFKFIRVLFEKRDPYQRHQRFYYNCSLAGTSHRRVERNPVPRSSYQVPMHDSGEPMAVFDQPRLISRRDLEMPTREIERILDFLVREVNQGP